MAVKIDVLDTVIAGITITIAVTASGTPTVTRSKR